MVVIRKLGQMYSYDGNLLSLFGSMSDPGTTYRTREEIQRMRSTQDPIKGLQKYLEDWGVASEEELKVELLFVTGANRS